VAEPEQLRREAVFWIERLTSGQATSDDAEAFGRWRRLSKSHEGAFTAARQLWSDIGPAGENLRRHGEVELARLQVPARATINRRLIIGGGALAAAASISGFAIIDPPLGLWPSWQELNADYRTRTGEQRDLPLGTGVLARMNTQTSISVQSVSPEEGRLKLISGELSLTMATGTSVSVTAADGKILTHGAQFSVRYEPRDVGTVCVTCLDGTVRVTQRAASAELASRQQIRYGGNGFSEVETIDRDVVSAWQRGVVIFRGMPLAEVVEEVNRYRPGKIILLDANLGRKLVSGRFEIADIGEVLTRIKLAFDAKVRSLPGGIVLLG
jgi:transmembrane sensor